jgi:tetratricopeptide (TPR) repeat protein
MARLIDRKKKISEEPDELQSATQNIWDAITENPKRTAAVAGGVLGTVLVVVLALYIGERAEEKKMSRVAKVFSEYREAQGDGENLTLGEELEGLAAGHAGTAVGGQSLYYLGNYFVDRGDHTAALAAYQRVVDEYGSFAGLVNTARLAQAYVYSVTGEEARALEIFGELAAVEEDPVPRSQIALEMGRLQEKLGKKKEAAATYRSVMEVYPDTPWSTEAEKRLSAIGGA